MNELFFNEKKENACSMIFFCLFMYAIIGDTKVNVNKMEHMLLYVLVRWDLVFGYF